MCSEALARNPPSFCTSVHEPVSTDIDEAHGPCPDRDKHPNATGANAVSSSFGNLLGITRTIGPGNRWYREQNQGQT